MNTIIDQKVITLGETTYAVDFNYTPEQKQTWHCPYWPSELEIQKIEMITPKGEIDVTDIFVEFDRIGKFEEILKDTIENGC